MATDPPSRAIDRELELAAAPGLRRRLTLHRWYGFTGMQARVARRLDGVTTVSENSRRDIVTHMGVPADGIEVIPVGIDPAEFRPPPAGQPRDADSILAITSADVALKGLVHLLEALAKLRTERPVRLTVVGTARPGGPAEAALDRLGLRDAVRFTGPVPEAELISLLLRAAVVAIPSLYEGFSLPAVQAMACGTPLVTTDAGALPEVVGTEAGPPGQGRDVGGSPRRCSWCSTRRPSASSSAGRPAAGARPLHLAVDGRAHGRLVRRGARPEGRPVLTVDYDRSTCGRDDRPRPRLRRGPARLRGLPAGRRRWSPDWGVPGWRRRSAGWARSRRPARRPRGPARGGPRRSAALPFPDASVDRVIASEVLEHIPDDATAMPRSSACSGPAAGSR